MTNLPFVYDEIETACLAIDKHTEEFECYTPENWDEMFSMLSESTMPTGIEPDIPHRRQKLVELAALVVQAIAVQDRIGVVRKDDDE